MITTTAAVIAKIVLLTVLATGHPATYAEHTPSESIINGQGHGEYTSAVIDTTKAGTTFEYCVWPIHDPKHVQSCVSGSTITHTEKHFRNIY